MYSPRESIGRLENVRVNTAYLPVSFVIGFGFGLSLAVCITAHLHGKGQDLSQPSLLSHLKIILTVKDKPVIGEDRNKAFCFVNFLLGYGVSRVLSFLTCDKGR